MLHTNVETDVFNDNKMAPLDVFIVKVSYKIIHYSTSQITMVMQLFHNKDALVLFTNTYA